MAKRAEPHNNGIENPLLPMGGLIDAYAEIKGFRCKGIKSEPVIELAVITG